MLWYLDSGENPRGILIRYYINLLLLGFYLVVVVGKLVQKQERDSCMQTEKQYTKNTKNAVCKKLKTKIKNKKQTQKEY